jgi:spermidine synthase
MDTGSQERIRYSITKDLPRADVLALYRAAGWFGPSDPAPELEAMIANSFAVSAAFDPAGHLVGMARALSDGVSDAYILDVVVDPAQRSQGIGRTIVKCLADYLASLGIDWIVCIGVPGTEAFYRAAGANPMDGHTPFRFGAKNGAETK